MTRAQAHTQTPDHVTGDRRHPLSLAGALALAEIRVFLRQPPMIALSLLLPAGLIAITAVAETSENPLIWAQIAGRNLVATQCITVYFVALNTFTARRHTLALKRLRTTALPGLGIVAGLLCAPLLVGAFQIIVTNIELVLLGAPLPQNPALVIIAAVAGMVIAALAGIATSGFTSTPEKSQWTMMPLFIAAMGVTAVLPVIDPGLIGGALAVPMVANGHLATAGWYSNSSDTWAIVLDLSVMSIWMIILALVSWRKFRWERRR